MAARVKSYWVERRGGGWQLWYSGPTSSYSLTSVFPSRIGDSLKGQKTGGGYDVFNRGEAVAHETTIAEAKRTAKRIADPEVRLLMAQAGSARTRKGMATTFVRIRINPGLWVGPPGRHFYAQVEHKSEYGQPAHYYAQVRGNGGRLVWEEPERTLVAAKRVALAATENYAEGSARTRKPKRWIQGALGKPGALHRELGIPAGERIPVATLRKAAKATGKLGSRARLALTLRGFGHATHRHPSHPYLHPTQRKHRRR